VVEARITVGRFSLVLGAPHGTIAEPATDQNPEAEAALDEALRTARPPPERSPAEAVAETIEQADEITAGVERATALAERVLRTVTLDPQAIKAELNTLIDLAERADREGRFAGELRLARALVTLLSLTGRWAALVGMLQRAERAAAASGSPAGEAWAQHELGTFSLAGGHPHAAVAQLEEAARTREALGDEAGAATSRRNLELARAASGGGHRPLLVGAAVVAALALLAGGVAIAAEVLRDDTPTSAESTATQPNRPPQAENVTIRVDEDSTATWTPEVTDPEDDDLTCSISSPAANGSAEVESDCDQGRYTPDENFNGTDTFAYAVTDGEAERVVALATVEVSPVNDAPEAKDVEIETEYGTTADWTPAVTDVDGDELTCAIATQPENGKATVAEDCTSGTYTPNVGFDGDDSFTYTVSDPNGGSASAEVRVTVAPPVID
jgi:Bacterial Ig domain